MPDKELPGVDYHGPAFSFLAKFSITIYRKF